MEPLIQNSPHRLWLKSPKVKVILFIALVILVALVVVFSRQIGELFDLFGSKAEIISDTVELDNTNFLDGHTSTPQDGFRLDDGKLKLNPITPN